MKYKKKRCPFLVTKKENPHLLYDARCMVSYSEFKVKAKGFSTEHGCFKLAHKNCEYFLEAIKDEWWQRYLTQKGYVLKN